MKKLVIFILIFAIFLSCLAVAISFFLIFQQSNYDNSEKTNSSYSEILNQNLSACALSDDYALPDFEQVKSFLEKEQIVKDVPQAGKILIQFYHFNSCGKITDKSYVISGGKILQEQSSCDLEILISSDYAKKFSGNNLCEIIQEARNNGHLSQKTNASNSKLLWTYKSMLKYKDCLGISI